jgi:uncharacterized protein (TIGR00251 family)
MKAACQWQGNNLKPFCHLQPKASTNEFAGLHGDRVKTRLTAPPIDGKSNQALIRFLASQFQASKNQVTLLKGTSARQKTVVINAPRIMPGSLQLLLKD